MRSPCARRPVAMGWGLFTPGALTGVSGRCRLRSQGPRQVSILDLLGWPCGAAATFFSTSERSWGNAMQPRKQAVLAAENCGIPGHRSKLESFSELQHQNRLRRTSTCPRIVSAQTRRQVGRRQGLKILAREATNIKARKAPRSQADWLWDCWTPRTALTGTFVFAGAVAFSRNHCTLGRSSLNISMCDGAMPSHIGVTVCMANAGRY